MAVCKESMIEEFFSENLVLFLSRRFWHLKSHLFFCNGAPLVLVGPADSLRSVMD